MTFLTLLMKSSMRLVKIIVNPITFLSTKLDSI